MNNKKTINRKGAQASENSPVSLSRFIGSYYSEEARDCRNGINKKNLINLFFLCELCAFFEHSVVKMIFFYLYQHFLLAMSNIAVIVFQFLAVPITPIFFSKKFV